MSKVSKAKLLMIRNILTLRYDPTQKSTWSELNWKDFVEQKDVPPESIENLIKESIEEQVKPSQKIVTALSGGIDSTLVTTILKNTFPDIKLKAISVKFADSLDETGIASKISQNLDIDHHVITIDNYLEELPMAISISKMPFWDIHWYYVVNKASKFANTLLSGDGGDELFGGYTFRYQKFLENYNKDYTPNEKAQLYLQCHQRDWVPDQEKIFGEKISFSWSNIYKYLAKYFDNSLPPLNQVFLADYNGKLLYNWIPLNGSFHDHFGIKSITPILSRKLISLSTHLPSSSKYDKKSNLGKIHLRKILSRYIPDSLLNKRKQGFSVNTVNFWKGYGERLCDYYLSEGRIIQDKLVRKDWIKNNLSKARDSQDVRYVNKFLGLLALETWYRLFITKEMSPNEKMSV